MLSLITKGLLCTGTGTVTTNKYVLPFNVNIKKKNKFNLQVKKKIYITVNLKGVN